MNISAICPLCESVSNSLLDKDYYDCKTCFGIFLHPDRYLSPEKEKERYQQHNNDVFDPKYRQFVSPITNAILRAYSANDTGIDFGAGTGSAISKVLQESGFQILEYDPYFNPDRKHLENRYDYVVCCEVMEHFNKPNEEFLLLKKLLKTNGKLYCMTHLYDANTSFPKWYYRNDPTHVFIYRSETINWIKENYGFSSATIDGRLIILSL